MDVLDTLIDVTDAAPATPRMRMEVAMLGLPSRPRFLVPNPLPPSRMTLWERLSLSWQQPGVSQDIAGR